MPRSSAGAKPKARPDWWEPNEFLVRLAASGKSVRSFCLAIAADRKNAARAATLYNEVAVWVRAVEGFEERLFEVSRGTYRRGLGLHKSKYRVLGTESERRRFVQELEKEANIWDGEGKEPIARACENLGIPVQTIYSKMNPKSVSYDKAFAEDIEAAEAAILSKIRAKFMAHALDGKGNPWVQDRILKAMMGWRHNERSEVSLDISQKVEHRHTLELGPATLAALERQRKALMPARDEGTVIDIIAAPVIEQVS